jgi:hypothetical protein
MMTLRECMESTAVSMILALAIATAALAGSQEEQRLNDIAQYPHEFTLRAPRSALQAMLNVLASAIYSCRGSEGRNSP